jgi:hypothetical protein
MERQVFPWAQERLGEVYKKPKHLLIAFEIAKISFEMFFWFFLLEQFLKQICNKIDGTPNALLSTQKHS